jgi:integrase
MDRQTIHVYQRADRYNAIGRPKSEAGERTVPLPPMVVEDLKAWRKECPKSDMGLVFPNVSGGVLSHQELMRDGFGGAQLKAGITVDSGEIDKKGRPIVVPKYSGLHALRHFYASWCINRKRDGGLELPPKVVQTRLGHSSITMTLDTYGHLFPSDDEGSELAEATEFFMAT